MNDAKKFRDLNFKDKLVQVYLLVKKVELLSGAIALLGILTDILGFSILVFLIYFLTWKDFSLKMNKLMCYMTSLEDCSYFYL